MLPLSALLDSFSPVLIVLLVAMAWLLITLLMQPRRFYFVRHGETLLNAERIKQGAEGGLSERGKAQAAKVAEALAPFSIQKIISSPYERARQTSELLQERLKVRISYSPLLAERRNPSDVIGKSTQDPLVMHAVDQMDLAYHDDDYRYGDEENFNDLKKRARKCLRYLAWAGAPRTCVVTHHAFLKMLLSYMLYRENLHAPDYVKLSFLNTSDNGGISVCEWSPWGIFSKTRGWKVVSYNEQAGEK